MTGWKGEKMSNFVWVRDRYINANHIVMIRECKSSFDMNSEITLDIVNANGTPKVILAEETPEELIEKICGSEVLR